jgi:alpha-mannosidase
MNHFPSVNFSIFSEFYLSIFSQMSYQVCQSCAMPMLQEEQHGKEKDESLNEDYCVYCYKDGEFTANRDMNQMIEFCVGILDCVNETLPEKITAEQYLAQMEITFPTLKRWQKI